MTQGTESVGGVLSNDSVEPGASVEVIDLPVHGVVNMAPDGVFLYVPEDNFHGTDSFTYRVTDTSGVSDQATVTIEVAAVNDAPVANPESYKLAEDGSLLVSLREDGVLANDSDLEDLELSAIQEGDVEHGVLIFNSDGTFTYTPAGDFFGTDDFSYRASDGLLQSGLITVTLVVDPRPDAPVAGNDSYTARENEPLAVELTAGSNGGQEAVVPYGAEWRFNDAGTDLGSAWRDPDYDDSQWDSGPAELGYGDGDEETRVGFGGSARNKNPTTYFRRTFPVSDADAVLSAVCRVFRDDGVVVYLNGTQIGIDNIDDNPAYDDFARSADDDGDEEIEFPPVPPALLREGNNTLAVEIHQSDRQSSDISFNLELEVSRDARNGVLANDLDLDGIGLTAVLETEPSNGEVVFNEDGTFVYMPGLNFEGEDSLVSLGIAHGAGRNASEILEHEGIHAPVSWQLKQDHPKRGFVWEVRKEELETSSAADFLMEATYKLCPAVQERLWIAAVNRLDRTH